MPTFYSPEGNPEVWDAKPEGYLTTEEWQAQAPKPEIEPRPAEALFSSLRVARDHKLAATDYLVMADYPLSEEDKPIVFQYRQALRDLPAQEGAPWDGGGSATPWPTLNLTTEAKSAYGF